jgi:hypothetical protein
MRGRRPAFRVPRLSERETQQLIAVNRVLDVLTEFGLETASRERLLMLVGEAVGALRVVKDNIGRR